MVFVDCLKDHLRQANFHEANEKIGFLGGKGRFKNNNFFNCYIVTTRVNFGWITQQRGI
jgi:hypothetical protein